MSPLLGLSNDDVKTIGAGATAVGVLLALFGPPLRHWWRSPLLLVEHDGKRGAPHWDRIRIYDDAFFLRLRVRNVTGCDAAEHVQVLVASYHGSDLGLEGRALEWSGLREPDDRPVTEARIPPGLQRHVDLLQISPAPSHEGPDDGREKPKPDSRKLDARLCVSPTPWGAGHRIPPGDHDIVLTVTAANAESTSYAMTISYDGTLDAALIAGPARLVRRHPAAVVKAALKAGVALFTPPKV